ncbi:hypothetical protein D3C78_1410770 [compost metagenome]
MHQVVGKGAEHRALFTIAIRVAQQLDLLAQVQVVAPAVIHVLPPAGLVDGHFAARGLQAVFEQTQLHIIDAAGQYPRVDRLQTGLYRLAVDQRTIAIDFDDTWAVRRDVDRDGAGLAIVDQQAVTAAQHQAKRAIRAAPE